MRRFPSVLGILVLAAVACGDGDDGSADPAGDARAAVEVAPGTAVIEAGDARFEFTVDTCLVGHEQTGSPYSRLSLSGQLVEGGDAADGILTVSVLVSQVAEGHEEHVVAITRLDEPSLGAADLQIPSRGGPAPDDWIEVGDGVVTGSGFELWEIALDGRRFPPGTLVADCPAAAG